MRIAYPRKTHDAGPGAIDRSERWMIGSGDPVGRSYRIASHRAVASRSVGPSIHRFVVHRPLSAENPADVDRVSKRSERSVRRMTDWNRIARRPDPVGGFSNRCEGGSKEEGTNERTNGGKPGGPRWAEREPNDRPMRCGNERERRDPFRRTEIVQSSPVSLFHPVVRFVPSFRSIISFHRFVAFHRRADPSLRASSSFRPSSSHPSSSSSRSSSSSFVASHAPERECSSCGFVVRVAMSRRTVEGRVG